MQIDMSGLNAPKVLKGDYLWPNELSTYKEKNGQTVMLIPDGFLMPGQSDGGIYAIQDPQHSRAKPVRITAPKDGWFYHRAMYVKLPGGTEGILTARATKPLIGEGLGELVWLVLPQTGFSAQPAHPPLTNYLQEVVLVEGPDVMFEVLDNDPDDDMLEIVAAHFFGRKLSIHSIRSTKHFPFVEVVESSFIDTVGRPYGLSLAAFTQPNSDTNSGSVSGTSDSVAYSSNAGSSGFQRYSFVNRVNRSKYLSRKRERSEKNSRKGASISVAQDRSLCSNDFPTHILVTTHECSYDLSSAVQMAFSTIHGDYPQVKTNNGHVGKASLGQSIHTDSSNVLTNPTTSKSSRGNDVVRLLEYDPDAPNTVNGGSLFAYEIPTKKSITKAAAVLSDASPLKKTFTNLTDFSAEFDNSVASIVDDLSHNAALKQSSAFNIHENPLAAWKRSTLFRGFKVRGWGGIFSPGAPGFPYVFRMPNKPEVSQYSPRTPSASRSLNCFIIILYVNYSRLR